MKLLKLIFLVPPAALVVIAVRLLARRGILIRFGEIWSSRIGHMAGNMECYLCEKEAGLSKGFDIWIHRGEPTSKQLAKMLGRVIHIGPTWFFHVVMVINGLFEGSEKHVITTSQLDRDINNLYAKQKPHLSFTKQEEEQGREGLKKLGIPEGAKWVCLIVRDSAYLPQLGYHSYRDSEIDTYELAVRALADRGYYVVRMGVKVKKPLKVDHPKVIDFATNGTHSDFMSIYLGAHCEFAVSNGTGIDAIPAIFRRPICFVNYAPLEYLNTWIPNSLAIFKHYEKDGKRMALKEVYDSKCGQFMSTPDFLDAGISLVDNTPEEIREVVLEMADGAKTDDQEKFWKDFPRSNSAYNDKPLHGEIKMRIGAKFCAQYS